MPIEDLAGVRLHTQALGPPAAPPVVCVHGLFTGSLTSWYFTVAPALAPDHRVVMYDLRGHGRSPRAGEAWGVRAHAADLARVLDRHVEGRPATVVGHSAGGAIALRYALAHPARVARLVLVDTPLPLLKRSWIAGVRASRRTALLRLLPVAQRKAFHRDGRQAQRLTAQVRALANETTLVDDILAEPDFPDAELGTVATPVLLCYGTRGVEAATGTGARLAKRLPAARLTLLEGGHYLPIEAGPQLAGAIRAFPDG